MPIDDRDCRSEGELSNLPDEALLAYVVEERDAGRPHCAKKAVAVLAFGYQDFIHYRVKAKVTIADVEDVTAIVLESVVRSAFDGRSVGEFKNWLKVIAQRRVADYHGKREGRPPIEPLGSEHEGEDEVWGNEPATGDEAAAIAIRELAGRLLEQRNQIHQLVIRLYGPNELNYMGLGAAETAAQVEQAHATTMSEANVHQIWRRFKKEFGDELSLGGS